MKDAIRPRKMALWPLIFAILLWASAPAPSPAMTVNDLALYWYNAASDATPDPNLSREVLAKAQPDECFYGVTCPPGSPATNIYDPYGADPCVKNKVNQAYVWGLAKAGNDLWFGTAPNVHCLVLGALGTVTGDLNPNENEAWVCEFGCTQYINPFVAGPVPAPVGDWRPPRLFVYKGKEQLLVEKTGLLPGPPAFDLGRLQTSTGIRSAGRLGDVVILAGPSLQAGINLFAFNTKTGDFIGSETLTAYNNIRKWLVVNGILYTAVGNTGGGGTVLRWNGDAGNPFLFEVVGNLDGAGAELAYHEGRLFVTTWPELALGQMGRAALWMSPVIPEGGLANIDADSWAKVWDADAYEPDPVTAATYGGGALASFDGYLYWGTMNVPTAAWAIHTVYYSINPGTQAQVGYPDLVDGSSDDKEAKALLATHRPISIFRGRNFGGLPDIQLVYGMAQLPVFTATPDPPPPAGTGGKWTNAQWSLQDNNMGMAPLYGSAGFNNVFNNYTWTMSVFNNQLYVGTMDFAYLLEGIDLGGLSGADIPGYSHGADLYRFPSSSLPAIPESIEGVGNFSNYGVRTMISDDALYLGMANPMNLLTNEQGVNIGGWELIRLQDSEMAVGPVAANDPALGGDYDAGLQVNSGELEGAKMVYDSSEPVPPVLGPMDDVPPLNVPGMRGVGVPMNLQPSGTVFDKPVKIFIPCPGRTTVDDLDVYFYDGTDWIFACGPDGVVDPGAVGVYVDGSRTNDNSTTPPVIEVHFLHFTGVQAGGVAPQGGGTGGTGTVLSPSSGGGGGGGDGCFLKAAGDGFAVAMVTVFILGLVAAALATVLSIRKAR